jgi:hypothetical protein
MKRRQMPSSGSPHDINVEVAQRVANKLFEGIPALHNVNELYLVLHFDYKHWPTKNYEKSKSEFF